MAYEDTNCPCGGKKERETMLCADCQTAFADNVQMKILRDASALFEWKRSSAIALLSLARRRNRNLNLNR